MNKTDIERVQTYLRRLFGTDRIKVVPPARAAFLAWLSALTGSPLDGASVDAATADGAELMDRACPLPLEFALERLPPWRVLRP